MHKNYPMPNYDTASIKAWYHTLKNSCTCPCCQVMQPTATAIEFHHLDRASKCDTLSNMVHCFAPLDVIMAETLKVTPICHSHHLRYHQLERYSHTDLIKNLYNFEHDRHYQAAIEQFHATAWVIAPPTMQGAYIDYMENGFEVCARQDKRFATPTLPHGQVLRART